MMFFLVKNIIFGCKILPKLGSLGCAEGPPLAEMRKAFPLLCLRLVFFAPYEIYEPVWGKRHIQDIEAHLQGDIPNQDIDNLQEYWNVYPTLQTILLGKSKRQGYK